MKVYTTPTRNNGTEVTGVLQDSNFTSCLVPADKAENRLQIMFPLTVERARLSFKMMGQNLVCSPPSGVGALGIGHCRDDGECPSLLCTPTDIVMPQQGTGYKYKCHCNPVCAAIILDISGLSGLWNYLLIAESRGMAGKRKHEATGIKTNNSNNCLYVIPKCITKLHRRV